MIAMVVPVPPLVGRSYAALIWDGENPSWVSVWLWGICE